MAEKKLTANDVVKGKKDLLKDVPAIENDSRQYAKDFIEDKENLGKVQTTLMSLGGLWVNKSQKDGSVYLSGSLGRLKIMVFKNNTKSREEHPDYNMVLAEKQKPSYGEELVAQPTAEQQAEALAGM